MEALSKLFPISRDRVLVFYYSLEFSNSNMHQKLFC